MTISGSASSSLKTGSAELPTILITMDSTESVNATYALLAKRDLAASMAAYRTARGAIATAQGPALLALQEAVTETLSSLLKEVGEHGLQNQSLWGFALADLDIQALADECAAAWHEVLRLRGMGITSAALIDSYVGSWMDPVGSPDWLRRMALGVPRRQDPKWVARIRRNIAGEK